MWQQDTTVVDTVMVLDTVMILPSGASASDWIALGLTFALVLTAVVAIIIEVTREGRHQRERSRAADARISALASQLMTEIPFWTSPEATDTRTPEEWVNDVFPSRADRWSTRLMELLSETVNASDDVSKMVRQAYTSMQLMRDRGFYARGQFDAESDSLARTNEQRYEQMLESLRTCVRSLEAVVDKSLKSETEKMKRQLKQIGGDTEES